MSKRISLIKEPFIQSSISFIATIFILKFKNTKWTVRLDEIYAISYCLTSSGITLNAEKLTRIK